MKPIPAINENGEFVETSCRTLSGQIITVIVFAYVPASKLLWTSGGPRASCDFPDWPAVRERVERARGKREMRAASMAGLGVTDRPSFAEAIEQELRNEARYVTNPVTFAEILNVIYRARTVSGE